MCAKQNFTHPVARQNCVFTLSGWDASAELRRKCICATRRRRGRCVSSRVQRKNRVVYHSNRQMLAQKSSSERSTQTQHGRLSPTSLQLKLLTQLDFLCASGMFSKLRVAIHQALVGVKLSTDFYDSVIARPPGFDNDSACGIFRFVVCFANLPR